MNEIICKLNSACVQNGRISSGLGLIYAESTKAQFDEKTFREVIDKLDTIEHQSGSYREQHEDLQTFLERWMNSAALSKQPLTSIQPEIDRIFPTKYPSVLSCGDLVNLRLYEANLDQLPELPPGSSLFL